MERIKFRLRQLVSGPEIKLFLKVLEDVDKTANNGRFRWPNIQFQAFKKTEGKYSKQIRNTIVYLKQINRQRNNPLEYLINDYLVSVYSRYIKFGRLPYFQQLGPSLTNRITFDEWVQNWELEHQESYWIEEDVNLGQLRTEARRIVQEQNKIDQEEIQPETGKVEYIEI